VAKLTDYQLKEKFIDFIDDTTPAVILWKTEYPASQILREVDPVQFDQMFWDWIDSMECESCENSLEECACED